MVFQERWSFLPRAHSPYPAQSRVAARAGFCDEWEKTPPLLENHEKCIFSHATLCCQNTANNKRSAGNIAWENRSAHPGRTEVIHLLSSIRQQAQAITHPSAGSGCALGVCSDRTVLTVYMGHSGGDRCFVCLVHGRWTEVA